MLGYSYQWLLHLPLLELREDIHQLIPQEKEVFDQQIFGQMIVEFYFEYRYLKRGYQYLRYLLFYCFSTYRNWQNNKYTQQFFNWCENFFIYFF